MSGKKYVYSFGNKTAEGNASMKELLGGKGANLAEMSLIGVPVPPGFTITTEACNNYFDMGKEKMITMLKAQVEAKMKEVEGIVGKKFGDDSDPLLFSVRSGAPASMPGMMDTVLNLGMNDKSIEGFAKKTGNERAAWDSYRRFMQMYGDVVMGLKPESKSDVDPFEEIIEKIKEEKGVENDTELSADDLKEMTIRFRKQIKAKTGSEFPQDPWEQLWGAVIAVFESWSNPRAITYRRLNKIPSHWGTAVNVQVMVFGNMGDSSATGVAFTRDPATGENVFMGEYLINAQGEDVVAGTRTPQQISKYGSQNWAKMSDVSEKDRANKYPSLEEVMPGLYAELYDYQEKLEKHYADMQDLEFTIQEGKLWILQTRNGKRTGAAMLKVSMDMLNEGLIDEKTAILRNEANKLDELLHPIFDDAAVAKAFELSKGLPASPGATTGQIVFTADDAVEWAAAGKNVIMVRIETSPEDIHGMDVAKGILTSRGGMTSHAAVVARGMGKCCVSGAGALDIDYKNKTLSVGEITLQEGDWISLNGTTGQIFKDQIATKASELTDDFERLMKLADKYARLKVRTNSDTPKDTKVARKFGAVGIGLCRTEHMFFNEERILAMREMILSNTLEDREAALAKLLPYQRKDFVGIFEVMDGFPVTIRLLDPPLHEFLPHEHKEIRAVAKALGVTIKKVKNAIATLDELNPMLGHRGCRLGNTYPEITAMQTRAIIEAALIVKDKGIDVHPEIMVPLIGTVKELELQKEIIQSTAEKVFAEKGKRLNYEVGTMIEIPRAALLADKVAEVADFFSFGTNDLTQMTYGYSRDDAGKFLPIYISKGILEHDPFQSIDQEGVGQLVALGTKKGKSVKPNLMTGVCGEHGGDPASVEFFHKAGLDYVSCSPFRVPIARLVAGQAVIKEG